MKPSYSLPHDPEQVWGAHPIENDWVRIKCTDPKVWDYLSGKVRPEDWSRALWRCICVLIRKSYSDEAIARVIWFGPMGEKPRERGWGWLCGQIARTRNSLLPPP